MVTRVATRGPVIGILTMERTPENTPRPHFREMTALGSRQGLLVYAFAPQDVDWKRGLVHGFRALAPHGAWHRGPYPLPSILYDQTKSRRLARSLSSQSLRRRLAQQGTVILGPGFLTKNQVMAVLRRVPALAPHLPETLPASPRNVQALLRRFPMVYIKHAGGTLGFGVVRISRHPPGGYRWETARGFRRTVRLRLPSAAALQRHLLRTTRHGTWLAQQGVDLARYRGRPADIRLLVQKDGRGEWQVTTAFAKVAAPGQVVTNIGAGGSLRRLDELLHHALQRHRWNSTPAELEDRLREVSVLVAKALDRDLGPLAELGIDLGLDTSGHVWLIEANGKYSRAVFGRATRHLTIQRVFSFARFLNDGGRHRAGPPVPEVLDAVADEEEAGGPGPPDSDHSAVRHL